VNDIIHDMERGGIEVVNLLTDRAIRDGKRLAEQTT
jgi:hypothetical protein